MQCTDLECVLCNTGCSIKFELNCLKIDPCKEFIRQEANMDNNLITSLKCICVHFMSSGDFSSLMIHVTKCRYVLKFHLKILGSWDLPEIPIGSKFWYLNQGLWISSITKSRRRYSKSTHEPEEIHTFTVTNKWFHHG